MWTFVDVARIESNFGQWSALVTLAKAGVPESFYLNFEAEPTLQQAQQAATRLALKKNIDDGVTVPNAIPREDFFARFTGKEIAKIYRAANVNDDVFALTKRLEMQPTLRLNHPDVVGGIQSLEAAGLLAVGRANEILAA